MLYKKAYHEIKKKIIMGEYKPGKPLREVEIATELDISRTPLREAFQRLKTDGLVYHVPNSGIFVSSISIKRLIEMFEFRLSLEKYAVESIKDRSNMVELTELKRIHENYSIAWQNKDLWSYFEFNWKFHCGLVKLVKNSLMLEVVKGFQDLMMRSGFAAISGLDDSDALNAIKEHAEILNSIEKKNSEEAINAIEKHTMVGQERLFIGTGYAKQDEFVFE